VCFCLSVREHISGNTSAIFTNFSVPVPRGRLSVLLWQGNEIQKGRGIFGRCRGHSKALAILAAAVAAAFAAKGFIQYARQAQIRIRKILSAGDAAYQAGRG